MACIRKQNTGKCNHRQCRYSEQSGYECVESFENICDGQNIDCPKECEFFNDELAKRLTI